MSSKNKIPLREEEIRELEDLAPRGRHDKYHNYVRAQPSGYVIKQQMDLDRIKHMQIYEDDIFLVTPAKVL